MPQSAPPRLLGGDVRRLTLRLSLESLAAMLALSLASLCDALFLSRLGGAAAAGLCLPLISLIQTVGFTLGTGAGCFISRSLSDGGEDARLRARQAASFAFFAAAALGGMLCLIGQCFPGPLLSVLGAKGDAVHGAGAYARFVLSCAPLTCASLVLGSLLRANGYPLPGLAACWLGAGAGAGLCALLTCRLSLGTAGVGAAMLCREALILALYCAAAARRSLFPRLRAFSLRPRVLADVMRSGAPTLVRQALTSASGILMSRALMSSGAFAAAGMGLALRAVNLVSACIIGFSHGFSPVFAAACGAGDEARMRSAFRFSLGLMTFALLPLGAALFLFSPRLLGAFSPDAASAAFGTHALRAQSAVFFIQGAGVLISARLQSMGLSVRASLAASARQGYLLIALLLLLPRYLGAWGLILAQPLSDLFALPLCLLLSRGVRSPRPRAKKKASARA